MAVSWNVKMLGLGFLILAGHFTMAESAVVATSSDCLNARSSGQFRSNVVTCLKPGSKIEILGPPNSKGYVKARLENGQAVYVWKKLVHREPPGTRPIAPMAEVQVKSPSRAKPDAKGGGAIHPGPSDTTAPKNESCQMLNLVYSSNGVPEIPSTPSIWGGRATDAGSDALLLPDFIKGAEAAKRAGHMTMMYLEGPCGPTNGSDPQDEVGNCRRKFQKFNKTNRFSNVPDKTSHRWEPYTLAQLRLSKKYEIDFCEIDNLDSSYGLVEFFRTYKKLYDSGEIQCKLTLKNINVSMIKALEKQFGKDPTFLAKLNIFEADELWQKRDKTDFQSKRQELIQAMRAWRGSGAMTLMSKDSGDYRSVNFTQDSVQACGRGSFPEAVTASGAGPVDTGAGASIR